MTIPTETPIDLTMQSTYAFRLYIKFVVKFLDTQLINLTALLDTRAVLSIIHGKCLSKHFYVPTTVNFALANRDSFHSKKKKN